MHLKLLEIQETNFKTQKIRVEKLKKEDKKIINIVLYY